MEWQPIETAPKDGIKILICPEYGIEDAFVSWWVSSDGRWVKCHMLKLEDSITLPQPPT